MRKCSGGLPSPGRKLITSGRHTIGGRSGKCRNVRLIWTHLMKEIVAASRLYLSTVDEQNHFL
ncbi:hypothetical protein DPMN_001319 [Dreissena polymorpha]|uniref:Uncharacterized protein n=1 Tax=Dreissena polymorpha TaxID=45954 RepID=A0A9D4MLH1_DREPO|nr:hypothetical protein DPMN_001319 [Dreissena polymorpha]